MRKKGYYWVIFKGEKTPSIGYNRGSDPETSYPWDFVGSDEIFGDDEIERVICEVQEPPEEAVTNVQAS